MVHIATCYPVYHHPLRKVEHPARSYGKVVQFVNSTYTGGCAKSSGSGGGLGPPAQSLAHKIM